MYDFKKSPSVAHKVGLEILVYVIGIVVLAGCIFAMLCNMLSVGFAASQPVEPDTYAIDPAQHIKTTALLEVADIQDVEIVDSGLDIQYVGDTEYHVGDVLPEFKELWSVEGESYTQFDEFEIIPYIQGFNNHSIYTEVEDKTIFVLPGNIKVSLARRDTKETIAAVDVVVE